MRMKQKTIFIDVPCPISMRNVVTGPQSVYRRLKKEGYKVILLTPPTAADIVRTSYEADVEPMNINRKLTTAQKLSDFITKHLNLTRMQVLGSKYGLRHNLAKRTTRSYLHFVRVLIAHTLGRWRWFRLSAAPRLHLFAYRTRPFKEVFDRHMPDLVFVPNMGSAQGEETLRECKRRGVPTFGMVGSWDHPHKRYQSLQTDKVFVWSNSLKEEMIHLQSYAPENVLVVGAPHFDLFKDPSFIEDKEVFFTRMGLSPDVKLFTLFSGTGRAPDEGDIVDMLLKWGKDDSLSEPIQVHIRAYPGDREDHKKFDQFEGMPGVYTDWVVNGKEFGPEPINYFPDEEYMRNVVSLFYYSAAVVSVYSSASVEASIFMKPSINIGFDGYQERPFEESVKRFVYQSHFDKLFKTGAVLDTHSPQELHEAIRTILSNPGVNSEGVKKLQDTVCGVLDGRASERIVTHIVEKVS